MQNGASTPSSKRIELDVFGEDVERLESLETQLIQRAEQLSGAQVFDVLSPRRGGLEVQIEFDHERLSELGLSLAKAKEAVQRQLARDAEHTLDLSAYLDTPTESGALVPLDSVAHLTESVGIARIVHVNGRRGLRMRFDVDSTIAASELTRTLELLLSEAGPSAPLDFQWRE